MVFKNTDGYLSADLRPLLTLFIMTTVYYAFLATSWCYHYSKDKTLLISLNWHILAIVLLALFESLLSYIYYLDVDVSNINSGFLIIITEFLKVTRCIYARVMLIVVALGY